MTPTVLLTVALVCLAMFATMVLMDLFDGSDDE
jgi:hypothetical protein